MHNGVIPKRDCDFGPASTKTPTYTLPYTSEVLMCCTEISDGGLHG